MRTVFVLFLLLANQAFAQTPEISYNPERCGGFDSFPDQMQMTCGDISPTNDCIYYSTSYIPGNSVFELFACFDGEYWGQYDTDGDGVQNDSDLDPFDASISLPVDPDPVDPDPVDPDPVDPDPVDPDPVDPVVNFDSDEFLNYFSMLALVFSSIAGFSTGLRVYV